MYLKEIGINMGKWVDSTHDRDYCKALVNETLNLRVPQVMELDSVTFVGDVSHRLNYFYIYIYSWKAL